MSIIKEWHPATNPLQLIHSRATTRGARADT
jgi:hypothetical protein